MPAELDGWTAVDYLWMPEFVLALNISQAYDANQIMFTKIGVIWAN